MGFLPEERFFTHKKPFTATGVDYFGPFYTKAERGTRASKHLLKRYGVIFTCLTTTAINVEIAHSLVRSMMARRGPIQIIWSDNGTNFRGAARELQEALEDLDECAVKEYLAKELHTYKDTADWEDPDVDIDPYEEKHYATYSMLSVAREELQVQYARSLNNRFSVTEAREGHVSQTHVNLHYERIKLPTFSGNYEYWQHFSDIFLNLPTASVLNSGAICKLADGADEVIRGLRALECENRDPWLIHVLLAKVDNNTRQAWAEHSESEDYTVTIDSFIKFLLSRGDTLESSQLSRANHSRRIATTHHVNTETQPLIEPCTLCQHAHPLSRCEQFRALDAAARHAHVRSASLCFNCLSPNHRIATCPSKNTCRVCQRKHNTLIHAAQQTTGREFRDSAVRVHQPESPGSNDESPAIISHHVQTTRGHQIAVTKHSKRVSLYTLENIPYAGSQTLLPTILTSVKDARGKTFTCRALSDTGSTVSLATESFVQRIGMRRTHAKVPVRGLAANRAGVTRGLVKFRICSCNSDHNIEVETYIVSTLTSALPAQNVDMSSTQWKEILKLPLADPSFGTVGAVDVIFGSDQLWKFCTGEQRSFGPYSTFGENQSLAITHHVHLDLDSQVRSFMEMDSIPSKTSTLEIFDPTEQHFINTHTRSQTGTYVVEYPFKDPMPPIGETLPQAVSRLQSLERKFSRDPSLKREYIAFMDEYLKSGHMELLNTQQIDEQPDGCFYLPHHAVLKPESTTTKCRVVFDGSGKDSSGVSLNERLHIGPPIQRDLFGVCLRFRQHRYVCCLDIEKMFRKIEVAPHHTNYQRIIWRSSTMDPMQHYRLRTVTYGLAPSPFLAVRVLKQLAIDYEAKYPLAARVLARDAYVDDIPTGCNSVGELMKLKDQLISLLDEGKFKLRKWSSNSWSFLKSIPKEDCLHGHASIEDNVKILGIPWNPVRDEFLVSTPMIATKQAPSKRALLSDLSKVFDPLGFVAPTTVLLKLIFQECWFSAISWDDPIPETLRRRWQAIIKELPLLSHCRISRYIAASSPHIELCGFADASTQAYGAVIYSRVRTTNGYRSRLVAAKTRVAPLKPISIPRLELNAALLLSRLLKLVTESLTIPISSSHCWTDSEIVLHWLSSPPRRWNTYVCHRVAEIVEDYPRRCWNHVRSEENPADCASRGLSLSQLLNHE
ncbi:uncharacterized protein LOC124459899 [Drosophila willistoni]|uniref:uncharacterized protein LOC124459899 n=1 Tax=Drosophila willistoni TaxID=7260 RepID=UPI001F072D4F|nr:uncharacterized protein LOC124459899 [Drosophila willistoni]